MDDSEIVQLIAFHRIYLYSLLFITNNCVKKYMFFPMLNQSYRITKKKNQKSQDTKVTWPCGSWCHCRFEFSRPTSSSMGVWPDTARIRIKKEKTPENDLIGTMSDTKNDKIIVANVETLNCARRRLETGRVRGDALQYTYCERNNRTISRPPNRCWITEIKADVNSPITIAGVDKRFVKHRARTVWNDNSAVRDPFYRNWRLG